MTNRTFSTLIILTAIICAWASPASAIFLDPAKPNLPKNQFPVGPKVVETPAAEKFYLQGIKALAENKLADAKKAFEQSRASDPKSIKAILGLAEVYFKEADIAAAGKVLNEALVTFPKEAELYKAQGRFLYLEKKFVDAEAAFKKAIELKPTMVEPRVDLGDLYMNVFHKVPEAMEAYRAAIGLNPSNAGAHYALGMALKSSGAVGEAKEEFEEARRLEKNNPLPLYALARLATEHKDYDNGLKYLTEVLIIQPQSAQVYLERGDIYLMKGAPKKALAEYQQAAEIDPKFAGAQIKLGMVHQVLQDWNQAMIAYRATIQLDPNQPFAYNNLAWLLVERKGNLDDALALAQKAVDLAPGVAQFWDTLGWVRRARGEFDQSVTALQKAVSFPNPQAENYYHLGIAYSDAGKRAEALAAFQKVLALNSKFEAAEDVHKRLAELNGETEPPKKIIK